MFQEHYDAIRLVIMWSCALVFAATSLLAVIALIFPDAIKNPKIRERLHQALIMEIIVIGVGFFSHNLGERAGAQEEFNQTKESISDLSENGPSIAIGAVAPYLESSASFAEARDKIAESAENIWTVEASVDPFSDGPHESESVFQVDILVSDRDDNAVGELHLAANQLSQTRTIFVNDPYLELAISATSNAGEGDGDERANITSTLHLLVSRGGRKVMEKDIPLSIATYYHLGAHDRANSRAMSLGTVIREEVLDTAP